MPSFMSPALSEIAAKVTSGESLTDDDARAVAFTSDIITIGMIAEDARRARHGNRATYVRVATVPLPGTEPVGAPPSSTDLERGSQSPFHSAGEVRLTGAPSSLAVAVAAIRQLTADLGGRAPLSGFTLSDLEALAATENTEINGMLSELRDAGLDLIAELPLDRVAQPERLLEAVHQAGLRVARLTIEQVDRESSGILLARRAVALQRSVGGLMAFAPLARTWSVDQPSTGYDDVKRVALARLLVDNIDTIQVDWALYGPKLAQVALTFGADDLDAVSAVDSPDEGRRRGTVEEIRRNIRAASLTPVERNGRFEMVRPE